MSKFSIAVNEKGFPILYYAGVELFVFHKGSDLADLASVTQAALAEQNSRVMSTCKCDLSGYKDAIPPCPSFTYDPSELDECQTAIKGGGICAHGRDCHAQNTENQGE